MKFFVNITKMSLENGVMGLPISVCREWDALGSVSARLVYAGRNADITVTPKHINYETGDSTFCGK